MFFHLIQALGYVLLLFFLDCFVVGQLQREKIIIADFHVVLAHHSGHSSLNK